MLIRSLSILVIALVLAAPPAGSPEAALGTGTLLRLHVVAQDDTPAMQAVKYPVRDAVQRCYAQSGVRTGSMLADALALLPALTDAARTAARDAGFTGPVTLSLDRTAFEDRELEGRVIPAGTYPALMVRLGDARGRNWWGLLDPEASLEAACIAHTGGPIEWDWSLNGLFAALRRMIGGEHAQ